MTTPFERAKQSIPGGVNSPVRAFRAVGGTPVFASRGEGAYVIDVDDRRYIDYIGSWGPLIAGHAHPRVVQALESQIKNGTSFGMPTEIESDLAEAICQRVPACEKVRFVSSGTEAAMSAIRLARGATGRDELIKIEGCYHGHADSLLVQAGSGVMTLGIPGSPGVPAPLAALTHVVPFNDLGALKELLKKRGNRIAGLILEPIPGNMGLIPPSSRYLKSVAELTRNRGAVLIFDEVMTGFRVHRGGAQALYDIEPDLSCFGKVIGGGLPAAAYGGSAELMDQVAPDGSIYQAGTLSGNPLAMQAGMATLELLDKAAYRTLETLSERLEKGLRKAAKEAGVRIQLHRVGSMLTVFFTEFPVTEFESVMTCNTDHHAEFFHAMLEQGVYLPPSQFESWFVSLAHGQDEIDRTIEAAQQAFRKVGG